MIKRVYPVYSKHRRVDGGHGLTGRQHQPPIGLTDSPASERGAANRPANGHREIERRRAANSFSGTLNKELMNE